MNIIHIIGPGGSGKTTCGRLLSSKINYAFYDLDDEFIKRENNIGLYIQTNGYSTYCKRNFEIYLSLLNSISIDSILVLSSGFLCYDHDPHSKYTKILKDINSDKRTICLLASLDKNKCIELTVNRQMQRSYLKADRVKERIKIEKRYDIYLNCGSRVIENDILPNETVDRIIAQQVDAPEPATMIFPAWQHHTGRPGDL